MTSRIQGESNNRFRVMLDRSRNDVSRKIKLTGCEGSRLWLMPLVWCRLAVRGCPARPLPLARVNNEAGMAVLTKVERPGEIRHVSY
jgi:hypothetical protein